MTIAVTVTVTVTVTITIAITITITITVTVTVTVTIRLRGTVGIPVIQTLSLTILTLINPNVVKRIFRKTLKNTLRQQV